MSGCSNSTVPLGRWPFAISQASGTDRSDPNTAGTGLDKTARFRTLALSIRMHRMSNEHRKYHFFVGDTRYDWDDRTITTEQVKQLAGAEAGDGLLLEGHGHDPDAVMTEGQVIDLSPAHGGVLRFRLEPAAGFGSP
jgi:hypothetical protein